MFLTSLPAFRVPSYIFLYSVEYLTILQKFIQEISEQKGWVECQWKEMGFSESAYLVVPLSLTFIFNTLNKSKKGTVLKTAIVCL